MLQIAELCREDLDQVSEIETECFSIPWSKKALEEVLDNPRAFYITAKEEGNVIGYCGAYVILDEGDINQVAVTSPYRGRGVGRKMMHALLERLEQAGAKAVTLEVRAGNRPAIALYESLGFQTEGIRRNFYDKPVEDALIMWKR